MRRASCRNSDSIFSHFYWQNNSPRVLDKFRNLVELHTTTSVLAKRFWGCLSAPLSQGCVYTVMKGSWESFVRTPEGSFKVKCKFGIVVLLNNLSAIPAFDPVTAVLCVEVNRSLGNTVWCCTIRFSKIREWNYALIGENRAGMHTQALLQQKVNSALTNDIKHKLHNC